MFRNGFWNVIHSFVNTPFLLQVAHVALFPLSCSPSSKAVGESRVPVVPARKLRVPGAKKLMLDTRKYKIFALFMWKLELPVIWDFPAAEII